VILIRRASRASDRAAACGHRLIEASTCSGLLRNVRGRRSRASSLARESVVHHTHIRRMLIGVDPAWRAQTASRQCTSCRWYQSLTALWVCASAPISAGVQRRTARLERAAHARPPCSARQRLTESTAAGATRTKSDRSHRAVRATDFVKIGPDSCALDEICCGEASLVKSGSRSRGVDGSGRSRPAGAGLPRAAEGRASGRHPRRQTLGERQLSLLPKPIRHQTSVEARSAGRRSHPPAVGLIRRPPVCPACRRSHAPAATLTNDAGGPAGYQHAPPVCTGAQTGSHRNDSGARARIGVSGAQNAVGGGSLGSTPRCEVLDLVRRQLARPAGEPVTTP